MHKPTAREFPSCLGSSADGAEEECSIAFKSLIQGPKANGSMRAAASALKVFCVQIEKETVETKLQKPADEACIEVSVCQDPRNRQMEQD